MEVLWEVLGEEGEGEGEWRNGHSLIINSISFLKKHRSALSSLYLPPSHHTSGSCYSDAAKFSHKLEQNVFFSLIHPLTDLSVEVYQL